MCGNFRILMTMDPNEFDHQRAELQAWIKAQVNRPKITHNWRHMLAAANRPKPNF
jgi:hypothetical protein